MRLAARGGPCDKDGVDGQGLIPLSDAAEIARFRSQAEEALSSLYDVRGVDARAALEDARYHFERARDLCLMRGLAGEAARLDRRLARVRAVYDARFKTNRPAAP